MFVALYDSETKTYEASRRFTRLIAAGSVVVYALAVIHRDVKGTVTVKQGGDQGRFGAVLGAATGGLLGLFGGPLGVAFGAAAGMFVGWIIDLALISVGSDFLNKFCQDIPPGTSAIVAELDADEVIPAEISVDASEIFDKSSSRLEHQLGHRTTI